MIERNSPLTTAEFRERLLPYSAQAHLDLKTLHEVLAFWWLQLGEVAWEQLREDGTEVADKWIAALAWKGNRCRWEKRTR